MSHTGSECITCGQPFGKHGASHDCLMFIAREERIVNTFGALTKKCTPEEIRLLVHHLAAIRARHTLEAFRTDEPKTYDCDLCGKPGVCTKHIVHGAETMVCETCRERNE